MQIPRSWEMPTFIYLFFTCWNIDGGPTESDTASVPLLSSTTNDSGKSPSMLGVQNLTMNQPSDDIPSSGITTKEEHETTDAVLIDLSDAVNEIRSEKD